MINPAIRKLFTQLLPCICFFANLLHAGQDANFFSADGTRRTGSLQQILSDTVYYTITDASGTKRTVAEHKSRLARIVFASGENLNLARTLGRSHPTTPRHPLPQSALPWRSLILTGAAVCRGATPRRSPTASVKI